MRFFTFPVLLALGLTADAQQVLRKEPFQYAGTDRASRVEARPPGIRLGLRHPREFALAPLSESEVARLTGPASRLKKTGIQRALAPHSIATGNWETTPEGTRVWRMAIHSRGARGLRVEFADFSVGAGRVWVHDGTNSVGPYTGRGIFDDGRFLSGSVLSSSAIIEYEPAADAGTELEPPFSIRSIIHQVQSPLDATVGKKDPADYCELDANCYSEWKPMMSAVGQISFVEEGVEALCSGSLLATRDNSLKPYFLTAGHCIHDEAAARTVQAYWTYQTSACGATPPTSRDASAKSTLGAHLIASARMGGGDFSVILLQDVPAGVTFSGWDPGDPGLGADVVGVHHPHGSWKRISFGTRTPDAAVEVEEGGTAPANLFYQVAYATGRIEQGSSGSPLFSSPGVIVGSASYAEILSDGTVCTINPQGAGYSRFSVIYPAVKDYLENLPSSVVLPSKSSMSFTIKNHLAPAAQTMLFTTQAANPVNYKLRADAAWIQAASITGAVSSKTPASVAISVDQTILLIPGTYTSTVTVLSGAAAPQYVTVTAVVAEDDSNVVAAITPNPVVQNGSQWSFQIKLSETAGVATHITAVKFNGTDYTSSMGSWFGTTQIPASGTIVAPLTGTGLFPAGDQYFEFWGVDDASGQAWYRTAVVTFR
jgi:hypothetical protein